MSKFKLGTNFWSEDMKYSTRIIRIDRDGEDSKYTFLFINCKSPHKNLKWSYTTSLRRFASFKEALKYAKTEWNVTEDDIIE